MEKKLRYVWWGVLGVLLAIAGWKWLLPNQSVSLDKTSTEKEIIVYVTGAVAKPGLYSLPLNARLDHALKEAELLPEANLDVLNLAERLKDGQKITIPFRLEHQSTALSGNGTPSSSGAVANTSSAGEPQVQAQVPPQIQSHTQTPSATDSQGRININLAGVSELDQLPGIGPALAQRIIDYRNQHGYFLSTEDLQKVSGIGAKTYERLASQVTVGP